MTNILVSLTIIAILGLAVYKIVAMKKRGGGCAGCAQSSSCSSKQPKC